MAEKKRCRKCGKRLGARNRGTICAECRTRMTRLTRKQKSSIDRMYRALRNKREEKRAEKIAEEGDAPSRTRAEKLARRLVRQARKVKRELIKMARPTMRTKKRDKLARQTSLNTWFKESAGNTIKASFKLLPGYGPNGEDMYQDRKTKQIVTEAIVNRKMAQMRYHSQVTFIQSVMGGSYAQARKAFKAFQTLGILEALEIES